MDYPTTPDQRYFVVKDQLWRCTRPDLPEEREKELVRQLMTARRAVKSAKNSEDEPALKEARQAVNEAKVALGERGPVWWSDGAPDYNRFKVWNTPYAEWWEERSSET